MNTRYWKIVFIIVGFFFILNASVAIAGDTIKIGVIAPFKTPSGESLLNAAKLAAEDINAEGGIMGKKIELVFGNTEYKRVLK